tara:strand:- start:30402 stop:31040 length:639 start_codon:yes stop_codon:yes gene_type:complete
MEILAHRGLWKCPKDKNKLSSFSEALEMGFGIETDLRDIDGKVIISHDPPSKNQRQLLSLDEFLDFYNSFDSNLPLALNIKSDGLTMYIKKSLEKYQIKNYFLFDMSVPDLMEYQKNKIKIYCRQSEFESPENLIKISNGLWLDSFSEKYYKNIELKSVFNKWDEVAIVSPELHGYNKNYFWELLKEKIINFSHKKIFLCTDFPEEAKSYFE